MSMLATGAEAELRLKKAVKMFPLAVPVRAVEIAAGRARRARSRAWVRSGVRSLQSEIRYLGGMETVVFVIVAWCCKVKAVHGNTEARESNTVTMILRMLGMTIIIDKG